MPSALGGFAIEMGNVSFFVKPAVLLAHAGTLGIFVFDVLAGFLAYRSCERRLFRGGRPSSGGHSSHAWLRWSAP